MGAEGEEACITQMVRNNKVFELEKDHLFILVDAKRELRPPTTPQAQLT